MRSLTVLSCVSPGIAVIVEHVSQDILGVLETLCHLLIVAVERLTQRHYRALTSLIYIRDKSIVRVKKNLSVILEVNLYYFIT